jgi:hypothetical protein
MFEMTDRYYATVFMDVAALFLIFGLMRYTDRFVKRGRLDDKLYRVMLWVAAVCAFFDIPSNLSMSDSFPAARFVQLISTTIFFMALLLIAAIWIVFLDFRLYRDSDYINSSIKLIMAPMVITEVLYVLNLFFGFFFYVDESNLYHRGPLYVLPIIVMTIYFIASFAFLFSKRTRVGGMEGGFFIAYIVPILLCYIIPYVLGGVGVTPIGLAMTLAYCHMSAMNEEFFGEEQS